jgi:membrane dipeptidase
MVSFFAMRADWLKENGYEKEGPEAQQYALDYRARNPFPFATLGQVADHFDHVIELVGAKHVGIGSDFDGVGDSLPTGLKDVTAYPNLVAEFLERGYSEQDIAGILGGNLMRVWRDVVSHESR